jgi:hypothetical protein
LPGDALTAGAVARRLGVAVTTLRTWHQRYGLGPTSHEPGQHRRYTTEDLARLELMQRLAAEGVPPAEAARWARNGGPPKVAAPTGDSELPPPRRRDGGRGLALGRTVPAARGMARAALRLDGLTIRQIIADSVTQRGVVATWDEVLRPVLVAVGNRACQTGDLIEVEHLVSVSASAVLGAVPRPPRDTPVRTLLACADEEQHSLPIEALAAALAAEGVASRVLGARVPPHTLLAAVRRTGPVAILVWSSDAATADPSTLVAVTHGPRRPLVVAAGGPGWQHAHLPPSVAQPRSLDEAQRLLKAAVT